MLVRIVENTNYETVYGFLEVKDKTTEEIQEMIYEIKNRNIDDDIPDWEDLLYPETDNEEDEKIAKEIEDKIENYYLPDDWTLDDLFDRFPKDWEWSFVGSDEVVEV